MNRVTTKEQYGIHFIYHFFSWVLWSYDGVIDMLLKRFCLIILFILFLQHEPLLIQSQKYLNTEKEKNSKYAKTKTLISIYSFKEYITVTKEKSKSTEEMTFSDYFLTHHMVQVEEQATGGEIFSSWNGTLPP